MARVFVSHAGMDHDRACEVFGWLGSAGHDLFFDQNLLTGLAVGERWQDRLFERLRWADAVVCVVTSAYVSSAWCSAEVGIAVSRGSRVLPVLIEAGVRHPLLTGLQHADYAADPDRARAWLEEALRRLNAGGGRGWRDSRSPFPGLRPFDTDMRRVFFGRSTEVEELSELLRSAGGPADRGMLVITGPSGCGKSSLVRAGLIPTIADEPQWWTLPPVLPGIDPVAATAREITGEARRLGLVWQLPQVRARLVTGDIGDLVDELLLQAPGEPRRLLIVIDQLEELLTLTADIDRDRFLAILASAIAGSATLVGTLRPEFLTSMLANPDFGVLRSRPYLVRPLVRDVLPDVIRGPTDLADIGVDSELVAQLVGDTGSGDALPLLAFTLQQLAAEVPRGGHLSIARYRQLGGVRGALIRQADAALADAVTASNSTPEQVIAALLGLVTVDDHGRPVRNRAPVDDLAPVVRTELAAFTARRLLTTYTENNRPMIGVAHEAFLSAWPPLTEAITRHRAALRTRRAVETAAGEWDMAGRHRDRLWERGQLAAALNDLDDTTPAGAGLHQAARLDPTPPASVRGRLRRGIRRRRQPDNASVDLSRRAHDFLAASIRTDRRRRTRGTTVLTMLLVAALTAAIFAYFQQRSAKEQQAIATGRQLLAQAETLTTSDPRTAIGLVLAAIDLSPGPQAEAALFDHLVRSPIESSLTGTTGSARSIAFSPDGNTLVTGSDDGTVILSDVTDPTRPTRIGQPLTGATAPASVAFSPTAHIFAYGSGDDTVSLWDVTDPGRPRRITQIGQPPTGDPTVFGLAPSVAFAPGGRILAIGSLDGGVSLWDVTDPTRPTRIAQPLTGDPNLFGPASVMFAPDGHILATGNSDGAVILWDVTDPARPTRIAQPLTGDPNLVGEAPSVAFDPDGRVLTIRELDGGVSLWDIADPTRPTRIAQPLTGANGSTSMALSPDGHTLATGGGDGTVILWDVTDPSRPTRIGQPLTGHTGGVLSLAFHPDGHELATGGGDGSVILWSVTGPTRPIRIGQPLTGEATGVTDPAPPVDSVAFAPGGRILAAGGDGTVILWDVTDPNRPTRIGQPLTGEATGVTDPAPGVGSMAFDPAGRILATRRGDGTGAVILWDVTNPNRPTRIGQTLTGDPIMIEPAPPVAFDPEGRILAGGSGDGTVILWDVTDPSRPTRITQIGQPLTSDPNLVGEAPSVAFAPEGRVLTILGLDGGVSLWDVTDPSRPNRIGQPLTGANDSKSVAFSPDGHTLAAGRGDGTVILWDVTDPSRPTRIGHSLTRHIYAVTSVEFSPDGHDLATASWDGTVILWNLADPSQPTSIGEPIANGDARAAASVAFAPEGHVMATGSANNTVILWDLSAIAALRSTSHQRACSVTHGGLNSEQWVRYIPDLPYRDICTT